MKKFRALQTLLIGRYRKTVTLHDDRCLQVLLVFDCTVFTVGLNYGIPTLADKGSFRPSWASATMCTSAYLLVFLATLSVAWL